MLNFSPMVIRVFGSLVHYDNNSERREKPGKKRTRSNSPVPSVSQFTLYAFRYFDPASPADETSHEPGIDGQPGSASTM
jgi:hypothetical protein